MSHGETAVLKKPMGVVWIKNIPGLNDARVHKAVPASLLHAQLVTPKICSGQTNGHHHRQIRPCLQGITMHTFIQVDNEENVQVKEPRKSATR